MELFLSAEERDSKLNNLLQENEILECKIWATIMESTANLIKLSIYTSAIYGSAIGGAMGALTNQYCFMGISNKKLLISVVKTFKLTEENYNLVIPFDKIKDVKIKGSVIPGRKVIILTYENNEKMKISIMSNAIGSNIKDQKENSIKFLELISNIN